MVAHSLAYLLTYLLTYFLTCAGNFDQYDPSRMSSGETASEDVQSSTINTEDIISRLQQFAASLESELDDIILG